MASVAAKAQLALNEVFARPGANDEEFFELYNNAQTNININLDCYSMLIEFKQGSNFGGFYVIDFPSILIAPDAYIAAAPINNFTVQGAGPYTADIVWSSLAASGSIKKYSYAGGVWQSPVNLTAAELNDLFDNQAFAILQYKESQFEQALLIKEGTPILSTDITGLPSLTVSTNGACTSQTYTFSTLPTGLSGKVYAVGPASGTNNGYARIDDGNCSPWEKTAPSISHTPGTTNNNTGGTPPGDGAVNTVQGFALPGCLTQTSAKIFYRLNTTAFSGTASEGSVFPMTVTIFNDNTPNPGGALPLRRTGFMILVLMS